MTNFTTVVTAVWASASPTSSALPVPFAHIKGALVSISGAWSEAYIGLQVDIGFGWNKLLDWQGGYTGVSIPSASGNVVYEAPPSWFYAGGEDHKVKLWAHDGTGSGIPQGDARTVLVMLKG